MAVQFSDVEVVGISTCCGNVPNEKVVQNALFIIDLLKAHVPVFKGADQPLKRDLVPADFIHGTDGLGDLGLDLKGRIPEEGRAHEKMAEVFSAQPGEIELVCLGPLTNLALMILSDPGIIDSLKRIYIMGGLVDLPGNITPMAEFNIWADPDAAGIVFDTTSNITMIGWDTTLKSGSFTLKEFQIIDRSGSDLSKLAMRLQQPRIRWMRENDEEILINLADPLTMSVVLDPDLITKTGYFEMSVNNNDDNEVTRGYIEVMECDDLSQVHFVHSVNRNGFLQLLTQCLTGSKSEFNIYSTDVEKEFLTEERCYITEIMNTETRGDISFARARIVPGVETALHALRGTHEFYYILSGQGVVMINSSTRQVRSGDLIEIVPGSPQKIKNTGTEDLCFLCICRPRFRQDNYEDLD